MDENTEHPTDEATETDHVPSIEDLQDPDAASGHEDGTSYDEASAPDAGSMAQSLSSKLKIY